MSKRRFLNLRIVFNGISIVVFLLLLGAYLLYLSKYGEASAGQVVRFADNESADAATGVDLVFVPRAGIQIRVKISKVLPNYNPELCRRFEIEVAGYDCTYTWIFLNRHSFRQVDVRRWVEQELDFRLHTSNTRVVVLTLLGEEFDILSD